MPSLFPESIAACQYAEKSQWAIGDAVLKECGISVHGVNDQSGEKIRQLSEILNSLGLDYAKNTLRQYRDIAYAFPHANRLASVSFSVHIDAGNPETLNEIVKRIGNERLTRKKAREIVRQIDDETEAKEAAIVAASQKAATIWQGSPTQLPEQFLPEKSSDTDIPPIDVEENKKIIGTFEKVQSNAVDAIRLASQALDALETVNDITIRNEYINAIIECSMKAHNKWVAVANKLKEFKEEVEKKSNRLSVVA